MIKAFHINIICSFALSIFFVFIAQIAIGGNYSYGNQKTVIGAVQHHTIVPKETLLDIVRNYGLGYNELSLLYPQMDPWMPSPGKDIVIPTQWILPSTKLFGIVVNLPEFRLYHFMPETKMVSSYPVGIGDVGWETPVAVGHVIYREVDPTWLVPKSLREKYGVTSIPPGPKNPLGKYWLGLSLTGYGIHGTNSPWGIGRRVSHGCIRLYPEHIALLFKNVDVDTPVEIIYEPVKIGFQGQKIFIEVHPDIYDRIPDMQAQTLHRLHELGIFSSVSISLVKDALEKQNGFPVRVGFLKKGGDNTIAVKTSNH